MTDLLVDRSTTDLSGAPVVDIRSLSKTYPGQVALDSARLQVRSGEVHALVGQNGSGKSTLIKLLGGYVKADHGSDVDLAGSRVDLWHLAQQDRQRIRIVHQDLGLVPTLSTVENLGLGRGYAQGLGGRILWRHEVQRAQELLLRFGLAPDVRQPVATLSAAERAAVAIVRALQDWDESGDGLLVLDEPTASLNRGEVDALFSEVRRVAQHGAGVLFVSHMLDEVLELADRVTVLRDGKVVAEGIDVADLDERSLVELIVGRPVEDLFPSRTPAPGRPALEAEMVSGVVLRNVSFKLHAGEVLGFAGLVGSGREEIANAMFGATPRFMGKVLIHKRKVFATPRDSIRAGVALVPAERKTVGLDMQERLSEHIPLPRLGPVQGRILLRRRAVNEVAREWAERLDVQPPILERRMEKFSGGNQQKAVLARWLRTDPRVLLLDEPTQGVDVGAKAAIYQHVAEAAAGGMGVLVASSDAEELVHLCDRVLVMRSGTIATELSGPTLTEERLIAETLGVTSNRKAMKINREPVAFTVIRSDDDLPGEFVDDLPEELVDHVVEQSVPHGRFGLLVRNVTGRLRKMSRRS
ncbi:sugar ABC transporter ATP-binding protein [Ilumatobacter sp.]|uniref:sugar ABC transporter ATP-binding protein n=1 Tax=Ilumatobacter sp. TaxID=1967498 RepID=UPI0037512905